MTGPLCAVEIGFPSDEKQAVHGRIGWTLQITGLAGPKDRRARFVYGIAALAMAGQRAGLLGLTLVAGAGGP